MEDLPEIKQRAIDYVVSTSKAGLNLIPIIGSFLAEITSSIIPNQRIDRVVKYLQILRRKLENIDEVQKKLLETDKDLNLLFEKSIIFSAQTTSQNKYEYYSEFIINSLINKDVDVIKKERMIDILSNLNEIEILFIIFYCKNSRRPMGSNFFKKYRNILYPHPQTMDQPIELRANNTFQEHYLTNLERYDLLEFRININSKTKLPEWDQFNNRFKRSFENLTAMGLLLAKFIGAYHTKWDENE